MAETPKIYERSFAKSDKTDAILVVQGKKLHVNKALLCYHSECFITLFNSDFKEFPIDYVTFEDFATLLSLTQENPMKFTEENAETLLKFSDWFLLRSAKRHVELFIITTSMTPLKKLELADKYNLDVLLKHAVSLLTSPSHFQAYDAIPEVLYKHMYRTQPSPYKNFRQKEEFAPLTDETKEKLFGQVLDVVFDVTPLMRRNEGLATHVYEDTFAETDKTDAILVVDGKKLHVNKALLSYHSDFFKALFNSNFMEKSMTEIPIDDVTFQDFATLLSLVQDKPIVPTESNAEKLLELADRFLLLPSVKRHLELFLLPTSIDRFEKIRIGEKYQLEDLVIKGISEFTQKDHFRILQWPEKRRQLSAKTNAKLMDKFLTFQIV